MTLLHPSASQPATTAGRAGGSQRAGSSAQHAGRAHPGQHQVNVGPSERAVSVAAGSILALLGLSRRTGTGLLVAGVGGAMLHRGVTGHCHAYAALGVDTSHPSADEQRRRLAQMDKLGVRVAHSFLISRGPEELYAYWRNLENLPRLMSHLESVRVVDDKRSHWVAKAPKLAGGQVEWDAEITRDEPNRAIAWRSLPGADVDNTGEVRFEPQPGDRGTAVHVVLSYIPPAGAVGGLLAKVLGEVPQRQVRDDLRKFKQVIEIGEVPTVVGQPRGTCTGQGKYEQA